METDNSIVCTVRMEWTDAQGAIKRKVLYKKGFVKLIRNNVRNMFIEISADKSPPEKFLLKDIQVHNKFLNEGKASIVFKTLKCSVYFINAPPMQLLGFFKMMFIKLTGEKVENQKTDLRTQLLSNKRTHYEEISPVTLVEYKNAKKKVPRATDSTPSPLSRKRKLSDSKTAVPITPDLLKSDLNPEQKEIFDACLRGKNVFFTGSAGTGKSYLLKKIIGYLPPDLTVVTASTGVAACHIGGITLHQFAGIGLGDANLERCVELASKSAVATKWRRCKHLIIDEISMVDGYYFQKIENVARRIRNSEKPFGGIQLIICGDFFQLPPVVKPNENKELRFCFQTEAWSQCLKSTYILTKIHRQTDNEFIEILNKVRVGDVSNDVADRLMATSRQKIEENGILATRLCSHMQQANMINDTKLNDLPGESKTYTALDSDTLVSKQFDQQTTVPGKLVLKVEAQVMLLKNINISKGLVNGARGVVKEFREGFPVVRFRNNVEYLAKPEKWSIKASGGVIHTRKQIPLKLAWAFSIHKSQGLTLDCVEMSLARVFEAGQAYVALSRAKSLDTLRVLDFKATQVWANPDVLKFYNNLDSYSIDYIPLGKKMKTVKGAKKLGKRLFSDKPLVTIN